MRETERRIRRYTARLPKAREKVFASLILFVFAISMMGVATFSWITLSIAPEVSGVPTTVAANGNLEIALVDVDGNQPDPSQVGDGDPNATLKARNVTWGNLINLSDPVYGLENITLRPASLNTADLLGEPLFAAYYTADGRVKRLDSKFAYAVYDPVLKTFTQSADRGIRAISSVEYEKIEYDNPLMAEYINMLTDASTLVQDARMAFSGIGDKDSNGKSKMDPVAGLMGTYTSTVLSPSKQWACDTDDVEGFLDLIRYVDEAVMEKIGDAMMQIFKVYQMQTDNLTDSTGQAVNYSPRNFGTDLDTFCAGAVAELNVINNVRQGAGHEPITFSALSIYISDRATLKKDITDLANIIATSETIYWSNIDPIVTHIVKISTVTLKGKTMSQWFSSLRDNISGLLGITNGSFADNPAIVHDGMLERIDKILHNGNQSRFYVKEITLLINKEALQDRLANQNSLVQSMAGSISSVKANVKTDAVEELPTARMITDFAEADEVIAAPSVDVKFTAKETYGLSLDLWLRTNHTNSFLVLEGDVVTESIPIKETVSFMEEGKDTQSSLSDIPIYIANIKYKTVVDYTTDDTLDEEQESSMMNQEVFSVVSGGSTVWYLKSTGQKIPLGDTITNIPDENGNAIGTQTVTVSFESDPVAKVKVNVIGYSGANRVWSEDEILGINPDYDASISTTQGSGSCYTFYSDTPEDMAQSLELIAALKVAFVDNKTGSLLATAYFDTEKYYAEYGKVTVPLYLSPNSQTVSTKDGDINVIMEMPKNEAVMVTAIVYLDGYQVTNDKVLSASEIDGTLNIQFGAYTKPIAMEDEDLTNEVRDIKATLAQDYSFTGAQGEDRTVTVNLDVTGSVPKTITANFIRIISQTHGSRYEKFTFTRNDDGTWTGSVVLNEPGMFVLRSIMVDGLEYTLSQESLPMVEIPGFAVNSVSGTKGELYVYRTAENYVTETFNIVVAAGPNGWPKSVKGVFQGEKGSTITTTYTGSQANWTADITFGASDTYTMKYVIIDDEYFNIDPITREVYTGLYTKVKIQTADAYTAEEERVISAKGISYFFMGDPHEFSVSVEIFDNSDKELEALGNVSLSYSGNLYADLTWNESKGCYDGEEFLIEKPGSYNFAYVTVSGEVLDRAVSATTITAATKDPVRYHGITSEIDDYVVDLDGGSASTITLSFDNAQAATVYGLFAKTNSASAIAVADATTMSAGATYYILAAQNNEDNTHTFHIPAEDGYWALLDVKVSTVFDGDLQIFYNGNEAAEWPETHLTKKEITDLDAEWYEMDETTDDTGAEQDYYYNIEDLGFKSDVTATKVVAKLNVNLPSQNKAFTGTFMQEHTVSGWYVEFGDFEGAPLVGEEYAIHNVKIAVEYHQNSTDSAYGGYTIGNLTETTGDFEVVLSPDADSKVFTQGDAITVSYSGTYESTLYYTVGTSTKQQTIKGPTISVKSEIPTVKITSISPTGTFDVDTGSDANNTHTSATVPAFTATEATVYFKCSRSGSGSTCSPYRHNYSRPSVTMTLTGIGNATQADVSFGSGVYIYNGTTQTTGYTWTANGTCARNIGYYQSKTASNDSKTAAGPLTSSTLTLTHNGVSYTFTIPTITINNPY